MKGFSLLLIATAAAALVPMPPPAVVSHPVRHAAPTRLRKRGQSHDAATRRGPRKRRKR